MDDFTPYEDALETTLVNLEKVLERCVQTNVALSTEKCHMVMIKGIVLGNYISTDGIKVDAAKIEVILRIPTPKTWKEDVDFLWTGKCGFLGQLEDKKPYIIYYISKTLTPAELNYMVTEKEFLEVVHAINKFQHYITGYQVFVHTNHSSIRFLMNKPITNGRITHWLLLLQEFHITIADKPGKDNVVSDFLSRLTIDDICTPNEDTFPNEYLFSISIYSPWYADIANYLAAGKFPQYLSSKEKKKIIQQSATYTWIDGNLYHTGPNFHIKHCVREDEVFDILKAFHEVPCGGHFVGKWIRYKVLSTGYYWLTIFQDAKKFVKGCDSSQRMGQPVESDEMSL
eukprot:PITA_29412